MLTPRPLPARADLRPARACARCRVTPRDSCVCVPDARVLGPGLVSVLPQAAPLPSPGAIGRVLRFNYTATVPATGLSCSGFVDACIIVRIGRNPPTCSPFGRGEVSNSLTVC